MDYSKYNKLEFRRKYFKLFGAAISIFEPTSNTLVGYIKMKAFTLRNDIRVFSDTTMQNEIVRVGGRQILNFSTKPVFGVFNSKTNAQICSLQMRSLRSYLLRWHVDILDNAGQPCGYIQETSGTLALVRRWLAIIPYLGILELVLAFVPQTFDVMYTAPGGSSLLGAKIVHKKNPILVRMSLDTTEAQTKIDPMILVASCSLLCVFDMNKNA